METIKIHKPKEKIKELNQENIIDILHLLQPVTYTDNEHQADWYGNGFGKLINVKQQVYITLLKESILNCTTKYQIQYLFSQLHKNVNCFPAWVQEDLKRKGQKEFWESEFGKKLLSEWKWMINKFVSHLNNMVEVPNKV